MPSHEIQTYVNTGMLTIILACLGISIPWIASHLHNMHMHNLARFEAVSIRIDAINQRFDALLAQDHVRREEFNEVRLRQIETFDRFNKVEGYIESERRRAHRDRDMDGG